MFSSKLIHTHIHVLIKTFDKEQFEKFTNLIEQVQQL